MEEGTEESVITVSILKMLSLCEHVDLDIDKESKIVTVLRGAIFPYFAWSVKLQADTPRLKCSVCNKFVVIKGYIIKRDKAALYTPRQEVSSGKTTTRSRSSKKDNGKVGGEVWRFVE